MPEPSCTDMLTDSAGERTSESITIGQCTAGNLISQSGVSGAVNLGLCIGGDGQMGLVHRLGYGTGVARVDRIARVDGGDRVGAGWNRRDDDAGARSAGQRHRRAEVRAIEAEP